MHALYVQFHNVIYFSSKLWKVIERLYKKTLIDKTELIYDETCECFYIIICDIY